MITKKILEAKNLNILNKANQPIFNNFSFEINAGEIWIVIGPNGIGKSSLWEALIGIRAIKKGQIILDNTNLSNIQPADRIRLGMKYISQTNALFEDISVLDNLMIVAESLLKPKEHKLAIEKAIELFDLEELINKKPTQLSGGQKRRIELAKIIIGPAKLILIDEPFAAIDEEYTHKILKIFQMLQKEGISFFMNDHNIKAIRSIANYCIHLAHAADKKETSYIERI